MEGSEVVPVTDWLDESWRSAASLARRPWSQLSPAERVMVLIRARAGRSPVARFTPGELGRLVGIEEGEVHEVIEALIHSQDLGAESHPGFALVLGNVPPYVEPTEPTPLPDGYRAVKRTRRGKVTWAMERAE